METKTMIKFYENSIKELFERWRKETGLIKKDFSEDGIIDPTIWFSDAEQAKPKILFVLKETNTQCDLSDFLRKGGRWQTWNNVTRWAYMLRHKDDQLSCEEMWKKVHRISKENRAYHLSRIAVVNVSKEPGDNSTNTQKLIAAFEEKNKSFLPEELSLFGHLDYIVCCGEGVKYCLSQCYKAPEGTRLIDFQHPQPRYSDKKELFRKFYNAAFIL